MLLSGLWSVQRHARLTSVLCALWMSGTDRRQTLSLQPTAFATSPPVMLQMLLTNSTFHLTCQRRPRTKKKIVTNLPSAATSLQPETRHSGHNAPSNDCRPHSGHHLPVNDCNTRATISQSTAATLGSPSPSQPLQHSGHHLPANDSGTRATISNPMTTNTDYSLTPSLFKIIPLVLDQSQ